MGLAMVYGIVKNHGGAIQLYSEEGHGAVFRAYLPAVTTDVLRAPGRRAAEVTGGAGRVLVVDDESIVLKVASKMLDRLGYGVLVANGGQEAVKRYREGGDAIDLVIIDMIMPGMDGRECFRSLKEIDPDVKAILSSGYGRDGRAQEIIDEGMLGFVQKPYRMDSLSAMLDTVLKD